jgi:hypothetical protein
MTIKNIATGEKTTLTLIDPASGQNWVNDFIGNNNAKLNWEENEDKKGNKIWLLSGDEYDFWTDIIDRQQSNDDNIATLSAKDREDFYTWLIEEATGGNDLDDCLCEVTEKLKGYNRNVFKNTGVS